MYYKEEDEDYLNERDNYIYDSQKEVWEMWVMRYINSGINIDEGLKDQMIKIVEDWTGHRFRLNIGVLPPASYKGKPEMPPEDISF